MNRRNTNLLIILLDIIIVVGLAYFLILPSFSKVTTSQSTLQNEEDNFSKTKDQIETIKNDNQNYQELTQTLNKAYALIPQSKDPDNFVVQVEEIAKKNGATIKSVKITTPGPDKTSGSSEGQSSKTNNSTQMIKSGNLYTTPFEIVLDSSYPALINCLSSMNNMNRFVTVKSLNIKTNADNSLETTIGGIIYSKP
jgi:Tfp pilus assembly protein PilO